MQNMLEQKKETYGK